MGRKRTSGRPSEALFTDAQKHMFKKSPEERYEQERSAPVECLRMSFPNDEARRRYFLERLREKLKDPEFRKIEGFPIGSDEDILALSDPPYYTACPNPFLEDFIRCHGKPYDQDVPYSREPFAVDVSEGKTDPIYKAHSYHTKVPHLAKSGRSDGFAIASDNTALDPGQRIILKALLSKLSHIIVEGPVTHAGATFDAGPLFSYDGIRRQIVVGTERCWRELSLSGHWIQDALTLRWAELTSEISRKTISPSEVIERLLRIPVRERNVLDARKVYCDLPSRECVWSGGLLGSRFDVDHVLPYSLWRNNDLWNLLPANPQVNRDKGDRLPTNALLKRRQGCDSEVLGCASRGKP